MIIVYFIVYTLFVEVPKQFFLLQVELFVIDYKTDSLKK